MQTFTLPWDYRIKPNYDEETCCQKRYIVILAFLLELKVPRKPISEKQGIII